MAKKDRQAAELLADQLREDIRTEARRAGSQLPPAARLAAERHMGKTTVIEAYHILEDAGYVDISTKTGTIVLDHPGHVQVALSRYAAVMQPRGELGPWETACRQAGIPGRMAPPDVGPVQAEDDVASALELPAAGPQIIRRHRHAMLGNPERVVQLQTASYPAWVTALAPALGRNEKIEGGIYGALADAGIRPAVATETVLTRRATPEERDGLGLRGGSYVLTMERLTWDDMGQPIELLRITAKLSRTTFVYDDLKLPGS